MGCKASNLNLIHFKFLYAFFWSQIIPLTPPSHSCNSSFHPSRVPWGQMLGHTHLNCPSQSLNWHWFSLDFSLADPTSLVLLGSTTASQRVLAAAQAAEFGGKEKALTGFRGFLASSWMVSHRARTSFHSVKSSPLLLVLLMGQTLRELHWATSCRSLAGCELWAMQGC